MYQLYLRSDMHMFAGLAGLRSMRRIPACAGHSGQGSICNTDEMPLCRMHLWARVQMFTWLTRM